MRHRISGFWFLIWLALSNVICLITGQRVQEEKNNNSCFRNFNGNHTHKHKHKIRAYANWSSTDTRKSEYSIFGWVFIALFLFCFVSLWLACCHISRFMFFSILDGTIHVKKISHMQTTASNSNNTLMEYKMSYSDVCLCFFYWGFNPLRSQKITWFFSSRSLYLSLSLTLHVVPYFSVPPLLCSRWITANLFLLLLLCKPPSIAFIHVDVVFFWLRCTDVKPSDLIITFVTKQLCYVPKRYATAANTHTHTHWHK